MVRLFFKDGTYMDVPRSEARLYESQPDWDHTENLDGSDSDDYTEDE